MAQNYIRRTPAEVRIQPRKINFNVEANIPKHWNDNDPIKSHFLDAFSCTLPVFEQFFIAVINKNKNRIRDATLKSEARAFCGQEGFHAVEHRKYNEVLLKHGYSYLPKFEKFQSLFLKFLLNNLSDNLLLSMIAGGEHVTSFMGDEFLSKPKKWSTNADPALTAIWYWHAVEETEHKAVCFDVYQEICGKRWLRNLGLILFNTPALMTVSLLHFYLLKQDGLLFKFKTWKNYLKFMIGHDGFLRNLGLEYLKYVKRDFHPWDNNNLHLIKSWQDDFLNKVIFGVSEQK